MAKDKKKKSGKKRAKPAASGGALAKLKSLGSSTLAADVVAAALVATAAALKDPAKARRFASEAGDQLEKLSKDGVKKGGAMWQLALDIGRRALESMTGDDKPAKAKRAKPKTAAKPKVAAKSKAAAKPKSAAKPKPKPKPKPRTKRVAKKPSA